MATDRLINSSQGADMIAELITIATNISQINKNIDLGANKVTSMAGYTLQSDASNITTSDTLNQAVSKLEKRVEDNKNNISLLETRANTNAAIISQTYNSADCNMSVYLCQDNGAINESTYYMTDQSKMNFRVNLFRRLVRYWKDGVGYQKYRWSSIGLIATNNSAKKDMLTLDIPEVTNETYVKSSYYTDDDGIDTDNSFTWRKNSVNVGDVWYIRPHIEYIDLETGMEYTMYGAVYKVTAGVPCTIECDTLSCTELTAREQANENNISTDEAALVELVDAGAKNIIELGNATCTRYGVTAVLNSDGSIVLSGKAEGASGEFLIANDLKTGSQSASYASLIPIKPGMYTISGASDSRVRVQALNYNSSSDVTTFDSEEFTAAKQYIDFRLMLTRNADFTTPLTIYPMCCSKAKWDISQAYQPYRPSYQELTEQIEITNIPYLDVIIQAGGTIGSNTKIWKQGNHVFGQIVITSPHLDIGPPIVTLAYDFRPAYEQIQPCVCMDAGGLPITGYYSITTAGEIILHSESMNVAKMSIPIDFVIS